MKARRATPLTQMERVRIYICLLDCPTCGAHRGELCKAATRTGHWENAVHWTRSPIQWARQRRKQKEAIELMRVKYQKLREQVLSYRGIPDHE